MGLRGLLNRVLQQQRIAEEQQRTRAANGTWMINLSDTVPPHPPDCYNHHRGHIRAGQQIIIGNVHNPMGCRKCRMLCKAGRLTSPPPGPGRASLPWPP